MELVNRDWFWLSVWVLFREMFVVIECYLYYFNGSIKWKISSKLITTNNIKTFIVLKYRLWKKFRTSFSNKKYIQNYKMEFATWHILRWLSFFHFIQMMVTCFEMIVFFHFIQMMVNMWGLREWCHAWHGHLSSI